MAPPGHLPRYLGESRVARAAYRCDRCGAHWYPEMGERPPARCNPTPDWLRAHPAERLAY